jgi:hypothetical protein
MSEMTLSAQVDLSIAALSGDKEAAAALTQMVSKAVERGGKKGLASLSKDSADLFVALNGAGLKKAADAFEEASQKSTEREKKILRDKADLSDKLRTATADADKKRFKLQLETKDKELKKEVRHQKKMNKKAAAAAKERQGMITAYEERSARTLTEKTTAGGNAVGSALSGSVKMGDMGADDAASKIAGGLGSAATMGASAAASAGMAGTATALAAAAASIAMVAGPLVAVVGILAMAYGNAKDMNKELMQSASAFDLVGGEAGKMVNLLGSDMKALDVELIKIRTVITDLSTDWRLSSDEITGTVKALFEAGITMKEMSDVVGGTVGPITAFKRVTEAAIIASQGLGVEVSSVSSFMDKMSRDLGYHLNGIEGAFGLIAGEAGKAKMRTADFFSAINEASSGMALYNFRVSDTVTLMTELVEILGEDLAKTKISGGGTFSGMGMQERYKQAMLGGKALKDVAKTDANLQAQDFSGKKMSIGAKSTLQDAGLMGEDGQLDVKAMSKATGKEFRAVLASGKLTDVQERQLTSIRELAQAHKKGHGGTARALANLSKRGNIAAEFTQAASMFGGKMLSEMDAIEMMSYESVTGIAGDEFQSRMRLQEKMMAEFEALTQEEKDKQGIKTFSDAVIKGAVGTKKEIEEASRTAYDAAAQHAADSLVATRSITVELKNKIGSYLHDINTGMQWLVGHFGKTEVHGTAGQAYKMNLATADRQIGNSRRDTERLQIAKTDLGAKLSMTKGHGERDVLLKEEAELDAKIARSEDRTERMIIARKAVSDAGPKKRVAGRAGSKGGQTTGGLDWGKALQQSNKEVSRRILEDGGAGVDDDLGKYRGLKEDPADVLAQSDGEGTPYSAQRLAANEAGFDANRLNELLDQNAALKGDESLSVKENQELEEQLQLANDLLAAEEAARIAEEKEAKDTQKKIEDGTKKIVAQMKAEGRQEKLEEMIKLISDAGEESKKANALVPGSGAAQASDADIALLRKGKLSKEKILEFLSQDGTSIEEAQYAGAFGAQAKDFIYRGNGGSGGILTPIHSADEFAGMKPGGAIARALAGGGKGGGKTVIVNISGGDAMKVYQVVRRVLSETGYGDTKQYG